MNDTNMNEIQKHYLEKSKEARKILDTIPIPAQMRTKATVITNDKFEPVVAVECDFKSVDINNLHSVIAYDTQQRRWMDAAFIPEKPDPERYVVYAPDDWQLMPFVQVRIDTVIDHFNRKGKQPQDSFTAHVFVGEWNTHKDDNLIGIGQIMGMWWAILNLTFEQTEDASKAVFYYDWNTHKYCMVDDTDTSDPLQFTMYRIADSCKYAPQNIQLTAELYALSNSGQVMPKITFQQISTKLMTEAELDAMFPNVRQRLAKEAAQYEE